MAANKVSCLLPKINISFSGCGFLGIYHVGSYACWKEHQDRSLKCTNVIDEVMQDIKTVSDEGDSNLCHDDPPCFLIDNVLGASAGALVAAALLVDHSPEALKLKFLDVAKDVKSMTFGPFNPRFNVNKLFRDELNKV
jgi:patatin-like phospholipase domain-containing protein 2